MPASQISGDKPTKMQPWVVYAQKKYAQFLRGPGRIERAIGTASKVAIIGGVTFLAVEMGMNFHANQKRTEEWRRQEWANDPRRGAVESIERNDAKDLAAAEKTQLYSKLQREWAGRGGVSPDLAWQTPDGRALMIADAGARLADREGRLNPPNVKTIKTIESMAVKAWLGLASAAVALNIGKKWARRRRRDTE
ncbi:MAG: hypothetical protein KGH94_03170 [Candidatus Micrarchaeota archaeon]|nr:hypothetical protein [Candidatus Micrarchaeota archaeon]